MSDDAGADDRNYSRSVLPGDYFQRPSPARMWNYLQGGKDNYEIDRAAGEAMAALDPDIRIDAAQSRRFLMRAVRYVAAEGIRQFLDIGCGLPAPRPMFLNTHEVAQDLDPASRVVYSDNDKVVLAHARALLTSSVADAGPIDYIDADARDIRFVLQQAARTLDFARPIAVMFFGLIGHITDFTEARCMVATVRDAIPPGSYLLVQDSIDRPGTREAREERVARFGGELYVPRPVEQQRELFDGFELVEPGYVPVTQWRPDMEVEVGRYRPISAHGGVAHRP